MVEVSAPPARYNFGQSLAMGVNDARLAIGWDFFGRAVGGVNLQKIGVTTCLRGMSCS